MTITLATGNKKHPLAERGADLYETPAVAVHALLKVEDIPSIIWEPACGPGSIVRTLRATGRTVHATDAYDYGCPDARACADFLQQSECPPGTAAIVTNPPYSLAAQFVRKGLELSPLVIMLMRLAFLESIGRSDILDGGKLARVHLFANRLPMMHRDGWEGRRASSAMCFAWMVWNRYHQGPALMQRIRWVAE